MSEIGEAIAKTGLSALLLLAAGVLPPLAAGTVLQLVTGRFRRRAAEVFGARFCIWSTAPGVMLHEFSHALLCVVFRHRITDFALFSPQKNGNLGWVAHKWNPRSLWQNIGWAVTNTTITCSDTTPRRSRQWRSRPVPLSSL